MAAVGEDLLKNAQRLLAKLAESSDIRKLMGSLDSFEGNNFRYLPVETMSSGGISPEQVLFMNHMLRDSDFVDAFKEIHNIAMRLRRGQPLEHLEVVPGMPDLDTLRYVRSNRGEVSLPVQVRRSDVVPLSQAMRESSRLALADRGMDEGPMTVWRDMNYMGDEAIKVDGTVVPRRGRTSGIVSASYESPFLPPAKGGAWYVENMLRREQAFKNPQRANDIFQVTEYSVDPRDVVTVDFVSPNRYLEKEIQFPLKDMDPRAQLDAIRELGIPQYRINREPLYDPNDYFSGEG